MIAVTKYLKGCHKEVKDNFSLVAGPREIGFKVKQNRYKLNLRKKFLNVRRVGQLNKLLRESSSSEVFEMRLNRQLSGMICLHLCSGLD